MIINTYNKIQALIKIYLIKLLYIFNLVLRNFLLKIKLD